MQDGSWAKLIAVAMPTIDADGGWITVVNEQHKDAHGFEMAVKAVESHQGPR